MASILVVGSVAYDTVETPFGKVDSVLGGSASFFSLAASFFAQVKLVACVGDDFRQDDYKLLQSRDIDLDGLQRVEGKTFRWSGRYGYDLNDAETLDTQLNVFADFSPQIPAAHRSCEYVFLGNIDPALQRQVLSQVNSPKLIVCDTMNYWISRTYKSLKQTLALVDVLVINDAETRQLAQEANLVRAARKVLSWGPRSLVVKRGEYGVLMFQKNLSDEELTAFGVPGYPLEEVFDPTGAGDSFAGGFVGYLAGADRSDTRAMRQAIIFGSVMASFNVEKFSLNRLRELTLTEINLRYKDFRRLTHFDDLEEER